MDKLMKSRYNALMIEKVIDMCFENLNPTKARFN